MDMTKASVKAALGVGSDAELARFFSITRAAVHQWPEDEPIPLLRQYALREKRPELFVVVLRES